MSESCLCDWCSHPLTGCYVTVADEATSLRLCAACGTGFERQRVNAYMQQRRLAAKGAALADVLHVPPPEVDHLLSRDEQVDLVRRVNEMQSEVTERERPHYRSPYVAWMDKTDAEYAETARRDAAVLMSKLEHVEGMFNRAVLQINASQTECEQLRAEVARLNALLVEVRHE